MRIEPIVVERRGSTIRHVAQVGGRELFFEMDARDGLPLNNPADGFLLMALGPAMLAGTPIELDRDAASPILVENLERAQDVYHAWNRRFKKVPIHAHVEAVSPPSREVLATYSAGVDSMYTLLRYEAEVTSALMIGGFDMAPTSTQLQETRERNERLLSGRGIQLRFVVSNQRAWGKHFSVSRPFVYSAYLAAAGLFFGAARLLIASGYPYGHSPTDGSEPYLDPLWSNGRTTVLQTGGDAWRAAKLRAIADTPDLLGALRVCFWNQNQNCGKCPKCVRTMVTLRILGRQGPFPRMLELSEIRGLALTEHELHYAIDNALLASEVGAIRELRAVKSAIARLDRNEVLVQMDRWLLGGWLRRWRRRRKDYEEGEVGFESRPDLDL